jgi:hypothetical protein
MMSTANISFLVLAIPVCRQAGNVIWNLFRICDLRFASPNGFIRAGNLLAPVPRFKE